MKAFPLAIAAGLLLPSVSPAASIGVNFTGGRTGGSGATGPTSLLPTDVAGVVPQENFNNIATGSGTDLPLIDNSGTALVTTTLTFLGGGTWTASGGTVPAGGDEMLNNGFVFGITTVTVAEIPYAVYDLYIYTLNDAARTESVTLQPSTAYYLTSPAPGGFIDGNALTPYNYVQATSTESANPTIGANYVKFSSLTDSSVTFQTNTTTSNAFVNGFQIVQIPEPSGAILGLAGLGTLLIRRRRAD